MRYNFWRFQEERKPGKILDQVKNENKNKKKITLLNLNTN